MDRSSIKKPNCVFHQLDESIVFVNVFLPVKCGRLHKSKLKRSNL